MLCKWDQGSGSYIFGDWARVSVGDSNIGSATPQRGMVEPLSSSATIDANLLQRCEIVETAGRLCGKVVEAEEKEEEPIEIEVEYLVEGEEPGELHDSVTSTSASSSASELVVSPLMVAVAEREAAGWKAVAAGLRELMQRQEEAKRRRTS